MSSVELQKFVLPDVAPSADYERVSELADKLYEFANRPETLSCISEVNQPGKSSAEVQDVFLECAKNLGFESEKEGLFKDAGLHLRPDYFCKVGTTGILLEVERGKTTINNMDLLDFWKCHLCGAANHLFLFVPTALRQNESMKPRNEFLTVSRRLSKFFEPGLGTNVHSLCLFGY